MSDATERPEADRNRADADAWAQACAEDLAAEKQRRRRREGAEPGSPAEELRRLADAVADRIGALRTPYGMAAQEAVQQLVTQARAAVEPVVERNPEVFGHLAAAGSELLAAYRAAVEGQERRWTRGTPADGTDRGDDGPPGTERIDLD
ncbi:DUF5304 domain-containing protein [Streptomyces meridianus]|uniref:DUF5304 domain-containing protein n=1 Tax=Streptomyces meridianus TaxID=2938945 RepID=A0ABT0X1I1_9ACTN|nr:DUF5304 domain-containing protein [Streptomyces meridianus]MCM2576415.1 DUF5304 domain-containing protein [Streptomyces meridianus]